MNTRGRLFSAGAVTEAATRTGGTFWFSSCAARSETDPGIRARVRLKRLGPTILDIGPFSLSSYLSNSGCGLESIEVNFSQVLVRLHTLPHSAALPSSWQELPAGATQGNY